jgi:hypothetical protein
MNRLHCQIWVSFFWAHDVQIRLQPFFGGLWTTNITFQSHLSTKVKFSFLKNRIFKCPFLKKYLSQFVASNFKTSQKWYRCIRIKKTDLPQTQFILSLRSWIDEPWKLANLYLCIPSIGVALHMVGLNWTHRA